MGAALNAIHCFWLFVAESREQLKEAPFVIRRYDTDFTVLPIKVLDEIRAIPKHKLNAKIAIVSVS